MQLLVMVAFCGTLGLGCEPSRVRLLETAASGYVLGFVVVVMLFQIDLFKRLDRYFGHACKFSNYLLLLSFLLIHCRTTLRRKVYLIFILWLQFIPNLSHYIYRLDKLWGE